MALECRRITAKAKLWLSMTAFASLSDITGSLSAATSLSDLKLFKFNVNIDS
jgi:hypothetical protein